MHELAAALLDQAVAVTIAGELAAEEHVNRAKSAQGRCDALKMDLDFLDTLHAERGGVLPDDDLALLEGFDNLDD
jgi:hypothetical protein